VLIPGKGVTAGRRHLLQRGHGDGGGGEGGGGSDGADDAQAMALEANYDDQQEAIWWAANSDTPGATDDAVEEANVGNQMVAVPSWTVEDW
jgi:hypothetical protein